MRNSLTQKIVLIFITFGLVLFGTTDLYTKVDAATVSSSTLYQTTANVNLRAGSSNKHKVILTIPKGKNVTYLSKSGSWFKVKYANKTGFVSSSYLKKPTANSQASTQATVTYQTTANVNLRTGASNKHKVILTIPKGKNVTYLSKSGSWFKVKYANKTGFVSSSYLKKPTANSQASTQATVTYQTTANVNLRTGASNKHKVILTIPKGKNVTYLSKSGSWFKVKYANKTGFVSSSYLKKPTANSQTNSQATVTYQTTANVNLRTGASNKHKVILTIPKGKNVTYLSKSGSWFKVKYANKTGFVNSTYMKKSVIKETVPNYKNVRYYNTNIHIYTSNPNANLTVSKGKPNVLEPLSSIKLPNELAKINLGFFNSKMEHGGLFMVNGQVTSNHNPKYVIMEYKKTGKIDIRSIATPLINLQELEDMKENNYFAVGTSYSLVQNGKINLAHSEYFSHSKSRNPRTLFGQTKDGRFIMAVTDGRINGSSGLTASQSADVMMKLGAVEAVNLDGGGSSTLYINGNLINKLGESPRKIGSALFITK
ncbi:SH3 domain-containing protein [Bacillus sp. E214]|uniref:SH3 domain-containing protein n=1 Tax=Bacillus sp. E214 TaxID=2587156 RepID=UPI0011DFEAA9|nr:SH3 domain-containing protein [Bacillus sp. E214]